MGRRPLAIGLVAVLTLVMAATSLSAFDAKRTRADVHEIVTRAEASLALGSRIGRALAQERSIVLEALTEPASAAPQAVESLSRIEVSLAQDLTHLEQHLEPEGRETWESTRADLARVRVDFASALSEIASGDAAAAERRLDTGILAVARINGALEELARQNEIESNQLFGDVRDRLDRLVLVQLLLALAFVSAIGVTVAWVERLVTGYLERIERSNLDLDAFAGRVAHDVRNSLAPMMSAGAVLQSARDPALVALASQQIVRSVARARGLLDSLLAFSLPVARRVGGASEIGAACRDAMEELDPLVRSVGADVQRRVEASMVALAPELLHIVIANVVGNAVKFLDGCERREVRITGRVSSDGYILDVTDTGPGIPADALPRIFEPFYRASGSAVGGTGIGLATVRRVIDAHGGAITVHSVSGAGTTMHIELPLTRTRPGPDSAASAPPERVSALANASPAIDGASTTPPVAGRAAPLGADRLSL